MGSPLTTCRRGTKSSTASVTLSTHDRLVGRQEQWCALGRRNNSKSTQMSKSMRGEETCINKTAPHSRAGRVLSHNRPTSWSQITLQDRSLFTSEDENNWGINKWERFIQHHLAGNQDLNTGPWITESYILAKPYQQRD